MMMLFELCLDLRKQRSVGRLLRIAVRALIDRVTEDPNEQDERCGDRKQDNASNGLSSNRFIHGRCAKSPRHDGCVKPKRASRKSVEEALGKMEKERKVPEESDEVVKKRRDPNVSKAAQEDQPQSGKKTAGSAVGVAGCNLEVAEPQRQGVSQWPR